MRYSFNINLAKKYGLEEAIFLENLIFWVIRNRANQTNYFDGRTWTYNSVRAFNVLFPFWTAKQIRRVLDSLLKQGVIVKGNYNKNPYDRTLWYALAEEDTFICQYGQVDLPKPPNEFCEKGQPIPDIKPDIKPDVEPDIIKENVKRKDPEPDFSFTGKPLEPVMLKWLEYRKQIKKPYKSQMTIETCYKHLEDLSRGSLDLAEKIVEQSIANQWQGLFELKQGNGNTQPNGGAQNGGTVGKYAGLGRKFSNEA